MSRIGSSPWKVSLCFWIQLEWYEISVETSEWWHQLHLHTNLKEIRFYIYWEISKSCTKSSDMFFCFSVCVLNCASLLISWSERAEYMRRDYSLLVSKQGNLFSLYWYEWNIFYLGTGRILKELTLFNKMFQILRFLL